MRLNRFILGRVPGVGNKSDSDSNRRVPVRRITTNSKWKPVVELEVQNNVLEGIQKMIAVPFESHSTVNRKHRSIGNT